MQHPDKLAAMASIKLQGLHKSMHYQLSDCADHAVVVNTKHTAFSGNKWEQNFTPHILGNQVNLSK